MVECSRQLQLHQVVKSSLCLKGSHIGFNFEQRFGPVFQSLTYYSFHLSLRISKICLRKSVIFSSPFYFHGGPWERRIQGVSTAGPSCAHQRLALLSHSLFTFLSNVDLSPGAMSGFYSPLTGSEASFS